MSKRLERLRSSVPFLSWLASSEFERRRGDPNIVDFMFGNPQQMPLPAFVDALGTQLVPRDRSWFAYKTSEREATTVVARTLSERTGVRFDPEDVFMTNGGFAAIAVALQTICEDDHEHPDEVVFLSPPWFFYELLILAARATPVRVRIAPPAFDLPVDAIAKAIGPRTRAVLVNSPHNPSGRVWTRDDLARLARVLEEASARHGRPIWILSDEPYAKIVYDGRRAASPAEVYPHTIVLYSYGKQLLTPGQRVGWAAVPSTLPGRESLRQDMAVMQCATGFAFPNALLQHALHELDALTIDIAELERRRDRLVPALRELGYETTFPEGTFYVLVRAPEAPAGAPPAEAARAEDALVAALAKRDTFVLPGSLVELPGWVRLSLTANDDMIERGIAAFAGVMRDRQTHGG